MKQRRPIMFVKTRTGVLGYIKLNERLYWGHCAVYPLQEIQQRITGEEIPLLIHITTLYKV